MEFLTLISVIVSIILLIVFLVMAANVSAIKTSVTGSGQSFEYWLALYEKHIAWGRRDEALYALQEAIWVHYKKSFFSEKEYEKLKAKWEPVIKDLGGNFLVKQSKGTLL